MIVVSDSSPLVILAKLNHFDLLHALFSRVYISSEVHHEVVVSGPGLPGSREVSQSGWIELRRVQNHAELLQLRNQHALGVGELSTIVLAVEIGADFVLLDDFEARRLAKGKGLQIRGTLGVLETAFRLGHLADLRAAFAKLLSHSYIDKALLDASLRSFGLPAL